MQGKQIMKRLIFIVVFAVVVYQTGRQFFMAEEREARNYIYGQLKTVFTESAKVAANGYGLSYLRGGQRIALTAMKNQLPAGDRTRPAVVLIHGLDEPGRIWVNLAPVLDKAGFNVFYMTYPNDQKITASANLFFHALETMPRFISGKIVIIGHSMGGLVSREMLTSPEINYAALASLGRVPSVTDLIMVGTPNHGSQLARFRFVMELKEQILNLIETDAGLLQGLMDGTGAAGLDLIPGSPFLTRLNRRPHPAGVRLHVIAGLLVPWSDAEIKTAARGIGQLLPNGEDGGLGRSLTKMTHMLGDGLVSLDSATLDHIPLTRVRGNHMTMLRNLRSDSDRVPPAVPVILNLIDQHD
ncbi:MAG: acetyltransferase [Desulfobacterales bacterium]|nr:MAG: acetyltransferase [Desulfobacterales bacterium]